MEKIRIHHLLSQLRVIVQSRVGSLALDSDQSKSRKILKCQQRGESNWKVLNFPQGLWQFTDNLRLYVVSKNITSSLLIAFFIMIALMNKFTADVQVRD